MRKKQIISVLVKTVRDKDLAELPSEGPGAICLTSLVFVSSGLAFFGAIFVRCQIMEALFFDLAKLEITDLSRN